MFETTILPVVVAYATMRLRNPDDRAEAVTQAWYAWSTATNPDLPASVWARAGVRRVVCRRDLPGCGVSSKDALHRSQSGGGMAALGDRLAREPVDILIVRERLVSLHERYGGTKKGEVLARLEVGERTKDVAKEVGLTQGRISQLRDEFANDE